MKKLVLVLAILVIASSVLVFAQDNGSEGEIATATEVIAVEEAAPDTYAGVLKYFAAALAVGVSCIAGGIAVAKIGTAAMGAMSENAELSGKAIPYAGLAEGICLWGFLIGLLILFL